MAALRAGGVACMVAALTGLQVGAGSARLHAACVCKPSRFGAAVW